MTAELLKQLANELSRKEINKDNSLKTLQGANILDMNGEFTEQYSNLNKLFINK